MKLLLSLLSVVGLVVGGKIQLPNAAAIYSLTNTQSENHILVHSVGFDGKVKYSGAFATGGKGAHEVDEGDNGRNLGSQNPLILKDNYLFVVNALSSTVSTFTINPHDPTKLTLLGTPTPSGGDFPVSIGISEQTGQLCVANTGANNGIACFTFSPHLNLASQALTPIPNSFRPTFFNQTSPIAQGTGVGSGHVVFAIDGSEVYVPVKGVDDNSPGHILSWKVSKNGTWSQTPVNTPSPPVERAPFGMITIPGTQAILASDTGTGAAIYDYANSNGGPAKSYVVDVKGQECICWVSYSNLTHTYFLSDTGTNIIYEVAVDTKTFGSSVVKEHQLPDFTIPLDTDIGNIGGQEYLYSLGTNGTSINVLQLHPKAQSKLIQTYIFKDKVEVELIPNNLAGMGIFLTRPY